MYDRLWALPDEAEPVQRAQAVAVLSVGTEIIQLRHMAPRLGIAAELDAAFAAIAQGHSALAIARLHPLDQHLASGLVDADPDVLAKAWELLQETAQT